MAPGIGAEIGPYLQKGEWQISSAITQFATDQEYTGTTLRTDLSQKGTEVQEGGETLDVQATYALTRQFNLQADAPFSLSNYWSNVIAGTRYNETAHGLEDVVIGARLWLFNCDKHAFENLALGLGVRLPTGNADYQVLLPNSLGQDFAQRPVFSAIQPGSGAWALRPSIQGFKQFRYFTVFGVGLYNFSLRAQDDTLSLGAALNPAGPSAVAYTTRYVSTPDSYLANAGIVRSVPRIKRLSAFVGARVAGVPAHNVFGPTMGFRQPGYFVTIEPGFNFDTSLASYNVSVPIRAYATTLPNFLGAPINSDFTHVQVMVGVTFNLGGRKKPKAASGGAQSSLESGAGGAK